MIGSRATLARARECRRGKVAEELSSAPTLYEARISSCPFICYLFCCLEFRPTAKNTYAFYSCERHGMADLLALPSASQASRLSSTGYKRAYWEITEYGMHTREFLPGFWRGNHTPLSNRSLLGPCSLPRMLLSL